MAPPTLAPYWWDAAPRPDLTSVALPGEVDVAVVGSGYTGLSAALTLARAGRNVLVVEQMRAGEGASSRNAGLLSGNIKLGLSDLIGAVGLETACTLYREGIEARDYVCNLIEHERIDCAMGPAGRFRAAVRPAHYEAMAREAELLRRHLDLEVHMVAKAEQRAEVGTDRYHGGEVREDIAGCHPGLLHLGMLGRVLEAGARVVQETEVLGVAAERGGFELETSRGRVRASEVIEATNGYTTAGLPWLRRRIVPVASRIVATAPIGDNLMAQLMPKGRLVIESGRLFNYCRPSPDRSRILFGGRGALGPDPRAGRRTLYRSMIGVFPELEGVELTHQWDGFTGFTRDLLPHIGVRDGIHYAAGFCGSGTVWGTWLGRKVALKVLGDPAAKTAFERDPFRSLPFYRGDPWFLPPLMLWYGLCDRLGL